MTPLRSIAVIVGIGLALTISGCGNGPPEVAGAGGGGGGAPIGTAGATLPGTAAKTVSATSDLTFSPKSITVKAGDVIKWTNTGSVPHNVTFDAYPDLSDTSQNLAQGDSWEVKITVAGTYAYHCTIHPGMDGQITVGS
jgi:plastocyanin